MDKYSELAKKAVENCARTGEIISIPEDLPEEFYAERRGVFVTIYKTENGVKRLRGCVGTIHPHEDCIAQEIVGSAYYASREDERFPPIGAEELGSLSYEVSLLTEPELVSSLSELDPRRFGVIVQTEDGRCGLLLPGIEGVASPQEQIGIAASKGNIDCQREAFSLWRFAVRRHGD